MRDHEQAVFELVQKFGVHGVIDGLSTTLHDMVNLCPDDEPDAEPSADREWADRLTTLLDIAIPYACAIDGHPIALRGTANGTTLRITVESQDE